MAIPRMTDEELAAMESRLNIDSDALVSSILANEDVQDFINKLNAFIIRKEDDISGICDDHVTLFGDGVEDVINLGENAEALRQPVENLNASINRTMKAYESSLAEAVDRRQKIQTIDEELLAISEALVMVQKLENINAAIRDKDYYLAIVQCSEFRNHESAITPSIMSQGLLSDADEVIKHIENMADNDMRCWIGECRHVWAFVGAHYLYGTSVPEFTCTPVYENFLVKSYRGNIDSLRAEYEKKKVLELRNLIQDWKKALDPRMKMHPLVSKLYEELKAQNPDVCETRFLLATVAGWFIAEGRISGDGFCLISQNVLDDMWANAVARVTKSLILDQVRHEGRDVDRMVHIAGEIMIFSDKMEAYGLPCGAIRNCMQERQLSFKKQLMSSTRKSITEDVAAHGIGGMTIESAAAVAEIEKYNICGKITKYPASMDFIPALPLILDHMDIGLDRWVKFAGSDSRTHIVELYVKMMKMTVFSLVSSIKTGSPIPNAGYVINSIKKLSGTRRYFEKKVNEVKRGQMTADPHNVQAILDTEINNAIERTVDLFTEKVGEVIDVQAMWNMESSGNVMFSDTVGFLEAWSGALQMIVDHDTLNSIVTAVAKNMANRLASVVADADLKWTPDLIYSCLHNVKVLLTWPTLVALPKAKEELAGIVTMFTILLDKQLVTIVTDPQFITKHNGVRFDAMAAILSRYAPHTKKKLYVIPANLVKTLLQKLAPLIHAK